MSPFYLSVAATSNPSQSDTSRSFGSVNARSRWTSDLCSEIAELFVDLSCPTFADAPSRSWRLKIHDPHPAADRWLAGSNDERAIVVAELEARIRVSRVPSPIQRRRAPKRRDRAAYMREFRARKGSPRRWATKTAEQREAQLQYVRAWRARQKEKRTC